MSDSTNLAFPYLAGAQAQKHVTVNESLRKLDALVLLAIEDKDLTGPPGSPADGARYIPKATATGAWSGKEKYVAHYVDGAWEFYAPREGFAAYVRDEDLVYVYNGTAWVTFDNALDADLKTIAQLSPSNDDVIQRKSGAWTNRTMVQLTSDVMANGQLPFPATQNASANANTLDDYEEGTFTPTFTAATPPSGVTYTFQSGRYTKVGDVVHLYLAVILSNKGTGGSGVVRFGGLPFTVGSVSPYCTTQFSSVDLSAGYTTAFGPVIAGQTYANLYEAGDNVAAQLVNWSAFGNSSSAAFTGLYFV